jgi:hypothetical protein
MGQAWTRLLPVLAALAVAVPRVALADGIVMKPHVDGWRPGIEQSQQAIITNRGGKQRLIVAIDIEEAETGAMVWLLPVPAAPKDVRVDVLARFPHVTGREVYGSAREYLGNMALAATALQVWPALVVGGFALVASFIATDRGPREAAKAAAAKGEEVTVHTHIEKEGMVAELITTKEGAALYAYLAGKGLNLKPGSVPALDWYAGKDYSFVATWASTGSEKKDGGSRSRGVDLQFPAAELYFPLLPTSAYGERVVPATIRVAGHVTPRSFAGIEKHMRVGYHVGSSHEGAFEPAAMAYYTKIDINAPSKVFTQDLWISTQRPDLPGLRLATIVASHPILVFFALLLPVSVAASILVGALLYPALRAGSGLRRLALIGMANGLTLLAVLPLLWQLPPGWRGRTAFLFGFSLLFMLAFALAVFAITGTLEQQGT